MSKEKMLALIRQCARKLGRNPTRRDLKRMAALTDARVNRLFGSVGQAFRAAGLEPAGQGFRTPAEALLRDWASVARKMGKIPTRDEYVCHGRYSAGPFNSRWKSWHAVADAFRRYARTSGTESMWADVLAMIQSRGITCSTTAGSPSRVLASRGGVDAVPALPVDEDEEGASDARRPLFPGRPMYGTPVLFPGLGREPVHESGVIYVFGMVAHKLGFVVERMQTAFPDCEAMRQVRPGRWQRVHIEFELESRNFLMHGHRRQGCDLIVCWLHNWPHCPRNIEVIELRHVIKTVHV